MHIYIYIQKEREREKEREEMSQILEKPLCSNISYAAWCNVLDTKGWCYWDYSSNICLPNYDQSIFTKTYDPVISKSIIFLFYIGIIYLLFQLCEFIINYLKIFEFDNKLNYIKKIKCKIYLFEIIITSLCFIWFVHSGMINFIFSQQSEIDERPDYIQSLLRAASTTHLIVIVYVIEMIENPKMRLSLKIHHICTIIGILLLWLAMDDNIDLKCAKIGAIMMLYPFLEQTVFIQLLLYNLNKKTEINNINIWIFHYICTLLYIMTRLFIIILFINGYIDLIYNIDINQKNYIYIIYIISVPFINIILILSQCFTISALFHICSKSLPSTKKPNQSIKILIWILLSIYGISFYMISTNKIFENSKSCKNIHSSSNTIFGNKLCGILISDSDGDIYQQAKFQYASTQFPDSHLPSFIVYAKCDNDIFNTISYAKQCDYKIAIRSGGHQYSGLSSCNKYNHKCIQIDVSHYDDINITINTNTNTKNNKIVKIGTGTRVINLINKLNENQLFLPTGMCPFVAVGGHFQTGGFGMFANQFGLALDHVIAFDIILSDEKKYHITKPDIINSTNDISMNDEIYWSVMGGNPGSFGIITQYEIEPISNKDHPNSEFGMVVWKYNKEIMKSLLISINIVINILTPIEEIEEYGFGVYTSPDPEIASGEKDLIMFVYTYGDLGYSLFNKTYPEYIINNANEINQYIKFMSMKAELSELAKMAVFPETWRSPYNFVKGIKYSKELMSEYFINEFVDAMDIITQKTGVLHETAICFMSKSNAMINYDKDSIYTAFPHRDFRIWLGSCFYYKDLSQTQFIQNSMNNFWNKSLHLFGNGGDFRSIGFTVGDININNVWKYYYESFDKYNKLKKIKSKIDNIDLFSNSFTISPNNKSEFNYNNNNNIYFGSDMDIKVFVLTNVLIIILFGFFCVINQSIKQKQMFYYLKNK